MEKMTVKELQAICDQKGIKYEAEASKEDLIKLINENTPEEEKASEEKSFAGEY